MREQVSRQTEKATLVRNKGNGDVRLIWVCGKFARYTILSLRASGSRDGSCRNEEGSSNVEANTRSGDAERLVLAVRASAAAPRSPRVCKTCVSPAEEETEEK